MKAKRILSALLAGLMILGTAACGSQASSSSGAGTDGSAASSGALKVKDTVVVGNIRDITMVNPFGSNTTENLNLFKMTHSRLLEMDPETYEIKEGLAESYEVSEDGLVWTFKLRQGVKFHNGEECTADDVAYSFKLAQESSFTSSKVKWIEKIEKLDEYTIQFTLSAPYQDMKYVFAYPNICIVNEKAISEDPDLGYKIGTGPYCIDEWVLGDHTTLVRFEDYFGEKPLTKNWEFRLITEDSSRVIALENGEIDICIQPPTIQNSYIEENEDLELLNVVGNKLNYLALNLTKDQNKNQAVREAIAYCVDRDSIIAAAVEGLGTSANTIISPKTPFYNPDQTVRQYDPDKALQILKDAGVDPGSLSFTIICNGSVRETVATVIQSSLNSIGMHVEVQNLEASALKSQLNEKLHDAVVYNWAPSPGEGTDITFQSLFYSGSGSNRTIMADPEVDGMIDAAAVELDPAARQQIYYDLQSYIVDYAAFIPLYYETITMGVTKNLQNFVCDVAEQHTYTYAYVTEA